MNTLRVLSEVVTQFVLPPSLIVVRLACMENCFIPVGYSAEPPTRPRFGLGFSRFYKPLTPTKEFRIQKMRQLCIHGPF
jgi:hypothetical protein